MRFQFVEQDVDAYPVRLTCRVLEVSLSGYYAWRTRPESKRAAANRRLLADVRRLQTHTMSAMAVPACTRRYAQKGGA